MFAAHNILRDPPFSQLDLTSCRNLLIYLDREVHGEVLEMFHFALKPGGILVLGKQYAPPSVLIDGDGHIVHLSALAAGQDTRTDGQLHGRRALVVDADAQAAELLRQLLQLEGAQVHTATDAAAALEIAAQEATDVVITDLALPGTDGLQFLHALHKQPALRALPVVAVTGVGRPGEARRAIAAGFAAHLRKPVTLDKLLHMLRELLPPRQ